MSTSDQSTRRQFNMFVWAVMLIYFVYSLFEYEKFSWETNWGGISVFFIGIVVAAIAGLIFSQVPWFRYGDSASWKMFITVSLGTFLIIFLGVYCTESDGTVSHQENQQSASSGSNYHHYYYGYSRMGRSSYGTAIDDFFSGAATTSSNSSSSSKSSTKFSEETIYIAIFFLVILLIVGSAFIPHMWVMSGMIILTIYALLIWREWKMEKKSTNREAPVFDWGSRYRR